MCWVYQLPPHVPTPPKTQPHRGGYKKAKVKEPAWNHVLVKQCDRCKEMNANFYGSNNNDPLQPWYKCLNTKCKKVFTPFKKSCLKSQLGDGKGGASLSHGLHGGTQRSAQIASISSTSSLDNHAFGFVKGAPVQDMNGIEVSSSRYATHIAQRRWRIRYTFLMITLQFQHTWTSSRCIQMWILSCVHHRRHITINICWCVQEELYGFTRTTTDCVASLLTCWVDSSIKIGKKSGLAVWPYPWAMTSWLILSPRSS